jgi:tetratricopeptide (TPR) repeat protein
VLELINISLLTFNVLFVLHNYKWRKKLQYKKDCFQNKLKFFLVIIACLLYFPAYAADSSSDDKTNIAKSAYYYDAMKLIKSKSFESAIENLNKAVVNSKNDPDIYNYLGYLNRKLGNMEKASSNYSKALSLSPKHKGALEYQGEMFLTLGQLEKAEANLKKLESICFLGCEEEKMLKKSISKYKTGQKSSY